MWTSSCSSYLLRKIKLTPFKLVSYPSIFSRKDRFQRFRPEKPASFQVQETRKSVVERVRVAAERKRRRKRRTTREEESGEEMFAAVRRGLVRQFIPRHPYRMLIKRVSTVSKYLTAAAARRGDCGPIDAERVRYSFRGAVEPNVCQWASTVVPRHRVGGPRPPAKALPYATGTAMCTIYSFSFSLLPSLLLSHSLLTHPFPFPSVPRCSFPSHSLLSSRSPLSPPRARWYAREKRFLRPSSSSSRADFPFPSSRHASLSSFVSRHVSSRI